MKINLFKILYGFALLVIFKLAVNCLSMNKCFMLCGSIFVYE